MDWQRWEAGDRLVMADPPAPGGLGLLDIQEPFAGRVGVPFWMVHMPVPASYNGLVEHPECLAGLRLVRCRMTRIVERRDGAATAEAEVLEAMTLDDLVARPPVVGDLPMLIRDNEYTCASGPYRYVQGDVESDAGTWAVGLLAGAREHLLIWGEWGCDYDVAIAGNLLLEMGSPSPFGRE